jgi:hypothetical protein
VNSSFTASPRRHIKTHHTVLHVQAKSSVPAGRKHYIGLGFVAPQPTARDRKRQAHGVLRQAAAVFKGNDPLSFSV